MVDLNIKIIDINGEVIDTDRIVNIYHFTYDKEDSQDYLFAMNYAGHIENIDVENAEEITIIIKKGVDKKK